MISLVGFCVLAALFPLSYFLTFSGFVFSSVGCWSLYFSNAGGFT